MIFFKNHPCSTCLVKPSCYRCCENSKTYILRNVRKLELTKGVSRVFGSLIGGLAAPITKLIFMDPIYDVPISLTLMCLTIVILILLVYCILSVIVLKKIKYKLFIASRKVLSDLDNIVLFPEFRDLTNFDQ